jgi:hypothetical protein
MFSFTFFREIPILYNLSMKFTKKNLIWIENVVLRASLAVLLNFRSSPTVLLFEIAIYLFLALNSTFYQ